MKQLAISCIKVEIGVSEKGFSAKNHSLGYTAMTTNKLQYPSLV